MWQSSSWTYAEAQRKRDKAMIPVDMPSCQHRKDLQDCDELPEGDVGPVECEVAWQGVLLHRRQGVEVVRERGGQGGSPRSPRASHCLRRERQPSSGQVTARRPPMSIIMMNVTPALSDTTTKNSSTSSKRRRDLFSIAALLAAFCCASFDSSAQMLQLMSPTQLST